MSARIDWSPVGAYMLAEAMAGDICLRMAELAMNEGFEIKRDERLVVYGTGEAGPPSIVMVDVGKIGRIDRSRSVIREGKPHA